MSLNGAITGHYDSYYGNTTIRSRIVLSTAAHARTSASLAASTHLRHAGHPSMPRSTSSKLPATCQYSGAI